MRALIERVDPDVIVAMGLNRIVSAATLNSGRAQWINVHLGLLPRHRGPAPLFWAMHDGDAETGVSVHMMVERVDAGAVLVQKRRTLAGALYPQIGHLRMLSIDALYEALHAIRARRHPACVRPAAAAGPSRAEARRRCPVPQRRQPSDLRNGVRQHVQPAVSRSANQPAYVSIADVTGRYR